MDGVAPDVLGIAVASEPVSAETYGPGETIEVAVQFDEEVHGLSDLALGLQFGVGEVRQAGLATSLPATVLVFAYDVVAGDEATDGIAVGAGELADVRDQFGNSATRSTDGVPSGQKVDGVPPRVLTTDIVSDAGADDTYRAGDAIEVEVTFSEAVRADESTFTLLMGRQDTAVAVAARYASGHLTDRVRYRYTVAAGDMDDDGISYGTDALRKVSDRVGNALADDSVMAVAEQPSHKVDGGEDRTAPRITEVFVDSMPERPPTYAVGQTITLGVRFDENVVITGAPILRLRFDDEIRDATVSGRRDPALLEFYYVVADGDHAQKGIAVDALLDGTIQDTAGNPAVREFAALPEQDAHRVDGIAPTVRDGGVSFASRAGDDGGYGIGDEILIKVDFSEPVSVQHTPALALSLTIGKAGLWREHGKGSLTFRYVVQGGDWAPDGIRVCGLVDEDGAVHDLAGNAHAWDPSELCATYQAEHAVDGVAPTWTAAITSIADGGTYSRGARIEVTVDFNEEVRVSGSPAIVLLLSGACIATDVMASCPPTDRRQATLDRDTVRPKQLTFSYDVKNGDLDLNGIAVLGLVGGSIEDTVGNSARRSDKQPDDPAHPDDPAIPENSEHKVDAVAAAVVGVEITSNAGRDGTYGLGDEIEVRATFDDVVHVVADPGSELHLLLAIGGHSRAAALVDGSGTRTLVFRYTVAADDRDDDGISVDASPDSLRCGLRDYPGLCVILDDFDNPTTRFIGLGLTADRMHRVDGRVHKASLAIVSTPERGGVYAVGEHIDLALRFRRPAYVSATPELPHVRLLVGDAERPATYREGGGTNTLLFRYTVVAGDYDDDGVAVGAGPRALVGGSIDDADGDALATDFDGLAPDDGHRVDGVAPRAVRAHIVSAPAEGDTYGLGEAIRVEIVFDEVVHATNADGPLELVLAIGEHSRRAALADGSGTDSLRFAYTVAPDDRDTDGISIGPDALVGGVVQDDAGNVLEQAERRIPGVLAQSAHQVDGGTDVLVPTVIGVEIVTRPETATYRARDEIDTAVTFSETVHVDGGTPTLALSIGPALRLAQLATGSGTDTLVFRYVVAADDVDRDGISIGPGPAALVGADIADQTGNVVDRTFPGVPADPAQTVNGDYVPALVTEVQIVSDPGDGVYAAGDPIDVEVEFSAAVHVDGEPSVALSVGERTADAAYVGGSGTTVLTFRYVVESGDRDDDGVSIAADALAGGTVTDAAGNPADLRFPALAANPDHPVDAVAATIAAVRIVSDPGEAGYAAGDPIDVEVEFSAAVHVDGEPSVALSVGERTADAAYVGGSGTTVLTFRYLVESGDRDDDGVSIAADALAGGTVTDAAGNPADLRFPALAANPRHRVDTAVAMVARVEIVSDPGDSVYAAGDPIDVEVEFSAAVHVDGEPSVALSVGERTADAAFVGGSGTTVLTFRYVVESGDRDEDGVSIAADALAGGTVTDAAGNPADLRFPALPANPDHPVDAVAATIAAVRIVSDPGDGVYAAGDPIDVEVAFSAAVHVDGEPSVALSVGERTAAAAFVGGSGTTVLTFRYLVESGDRDDDGVSIAADALAGGTVTDAAGNPADLRFPALPANPRHRVDAAVPMVARVEIVSDPGDGVYAAGDPIDVEVAFSAAVHVDGEPSVALSVGERTADAAFVGGSGTTVLTFRYVVESGDRDDDGVSIAADALAGGTVTDAAGNPADLRFPALAANPDHPVDAVAATIAAVRIVSDPGEAGYAAGDPRHRRRGRVLRRRPRRR